MVLLSCADELVVLVGLDFLVRDGVRHCEACDFSAVPLMRSVLVLLLLMSVASCR